MSLFIANSKMFYSVASSRLTKPGNRNLRIISSLILLVIIEFTCFRRGRQVLIGSVECGRRFIFTLLSYPMWSRWSQWHFYPRSGHRVPCSSFDGVHCDLERVGV